MTTALLTLAMAAPPEGQGSPFTMFMPMIIIFAIFYFMLIRPQQRKDRERRELIANIKSGERVLFCGGLLGTVTNVKDATFTVKIAEGVKVEVARSAVSRVLDKDEQIGEESKT